MESITITVQVTPLVNRKIDLDPVPLAGRLLSVIEETYETPRGNEGLKGFSDADIAVSALIMISRGDNFRGVLTFLERTGRGLLDGVFNHDKAVSMLRGIVRGAGSRISLVASIESLGDIKEAIGRAIEEGRPGFAGGWVSSVHLDLLLGSRVPPNKRRDLMASLDYAWHTGLTDGRVNNPVSCDFNKKPRLYVTGGHPSLTIARPADVARAYEGAQK